MNTTFEQISFISDEQKKEWETCADYYEAYVKYNESLMGTPDVAELSEDCELIEKLKDYLPEKKS